MLHNCTGKNQAPGRKREMAKLHCLWILFMILTITQLQVLGCLVTLFLDTAVGI